MAFKPNSDDKTALISRIKPAFIMLNKFPAQKLSFKIKLLTAAFSLFKIGLKSYFRLSG